jgi:protease secretion system outer membrane protein
MKVQIIKFFTILILFFNVNYSYAEEGLTLIKALESAKLLDPNFTSFKINQQVQQLEVNKAFSAFLPQVRISASEGKANTTREIISNNNSQYFSYDTKSNSLQIRQTIYNQVVIDEFKKSKVIADKGQIDFAVANDELAQRVSIAYFHYALLSGQTKIAKTKLVSLEDQLKTAQERYAKGFGTITEISESEVVFKTAHANTISLTNNLNEAKLLLEVLIGRSFQQFAAPDPLTLKFKFNWLETKTVDYWLEKAMSSNKELKSLELNLNIADYERDKSRSAHLPSVDLIASKTKSESDANNTIGSKFDTEAIMLQLNVPIFQGGFVSATVDQSQGRADIAQQKIYEKQNQLKTKISDLHQQVTTSLLLLDIDKAVIQSSDLALEGTEKGFLSGFRSNIELLNAKVRNFQVKEQLLIDFYKLLSNYIQLMSVAGEYNEQEIKRISEYLQV